MAAQALEVFGTLSLAGGGNRCWWQAGVLDVWLNSGKLQLSRAVGTSAGAAVVTAALCGALMESIDHCRRAYAGNRSMWRGRRGAWFAHEEIYPAFIASFISSERLAALHCTGVELWVSVARLPRQLPETGGLVIGASAYLIEKFLTSHPHPKLASRFGLRTELHSMLQARDVASAIHLLVSAAAAPPFIGRRILLGRTAVDGGFVDNAPRLPFDEGDRPHLILLTRHYPRRPAVFMLEGRTYVQPSAPIRISTWGCTGHTDIDVAVEHGRRDAAAVLRQWHS